MKKYIVVQEPERINFEMMLDGLSLEGYEMVEGSFKFEIENNRNCSGWHFVALMYKVIE